MSEQPGNPKGHGKADNFETYIIDQNWERYTAEDHGTWKILYNRQREVLEGRACPEFFECIDRLGIDDKEIPSFDVLNKRFSDLTGWRIVAVPGLIPDLPFFKMLSEKIFPAGNFIRTRNQLDYIQEPDVFHDAFGHIALLAHPVFSDYLKAFGQGGLRAEKFGAISNLARLYWYTVEFGLIGTKGDLRIYGSGILSSPGESVFSLEDPSPHRIGFDLKRAMQTNYHVDDYQQTYFVVDSFEKLFAETYEDFAPVYEEIGARAREHAPAELQPGDRVITNGTQAYARARMRERA